VFKDKRLHMLTRLSVVLIIAPYLLYIGYQNNDCFLILLGLILLTFDIWSLLGARVDSNLHHLGRFLGLVVQAPYMWYAGVLYNDNILKLLASATALADGYTFMLGAKK